MSGKEHHQPRAETSEEILDQEKQELFKFIGTDEVRRKVFFRAVALETNFYRKKSLIPKIAKLEAREAQGRLNENEREKLIELRSELRTDEYGMALIRYNVMERGEDAETGRQFRKAMSQIMRRVVTLEIMNEVLQGGDPSNLTPRRVLSFLQQLEQEFFEFWEAQTTSTS